MMVPTDARKYIQVSGLPDVWHHDASVQLVNYELKPAYSIHSNTNTFLLKVKWSRYRPGVAQRGVEV